MKKTILFSIIFIFCAFFAAAAYGQNRPKKQTKRIDTTNPWAKPNDTTNSDGVLVVIPAKSLKPVSDKSIFGFDFGKPLKEIRECNVDEIRRGLFFSTCLSSNKPESNGLVKVNLETAKFGLLVKVEKPSLEITIVQNNLEGVSWETDGLGAHTTVIDAFISKYGEPHKKENVLASNPNDMKYPFLKAEWNFSDLKISYQINSIYDSIGKVVIETPAGEKYNKELPEKIIPPVKF